MLPDLEDFNFVNAEFKNEMNCEKWQKTEVIGHKVGRLRLSTTRQEHFKIISHKVR